MKANQIGNLVGSSSDSRGGAAAAERGAAAPAVAPLPCQIVTTASEEQPEEEKPPLPGPRQKQAHALAENIKWMADIFGKERIGFFTLTLGDVEAGGRFRNLRDRKEAQRRFHSLLSNVIVKRYQCGVTVSERHRNGGIHFHLVLVCTGDIHGQIDFAACFPPKDAKGRPKYKPDYATANDAIKREWAFWRRTAKQYGFGRHELQPMREGGEELGGYLAKYLRKDWEHRWPEDKGARCVRYFGHWSREVRRKTERRSAPPFNSRFGWMTPRARAWREFIKQVVLVLKSKGTPITEDNIKDQVGPKWAWKMGKLFESVGFVVEDGQAEAVQAAIEEHNRKVRMRWLAAGGNPAHSYWWHVTEITLDHLRPSPTWKKEMEDWELTKAREAEIPKRLKRRADERRAKAEPLKVVNEVADLFQTGGGPI